MPKTNSRHLKTERPSGVTIIVAIYFLFGFTVVVLGFQGYPFSTPQAFIIGLVAFLWGTGAVGLFRLRSWGWYLAVGGCVISLILYGIAIKQWFPLLEILTLPYLVERRDFFGLTKRIKKKWLNIAFVMLVITTIIWGASFYWTRKDYNKYIEGFFSEWYEQHWEEVDDLVSPKSYCGWNGGVYICRTVFLLFCAWLIFILLWRTRLETHDETEKREMKIEIDGKLESSMSRDHSYYSCNNLKNAEP